MVFTKLKNQSKKKNTKEKELTREQAKIEFGKRMADFVLVPIGTKKKIKKGKK